MPQTFDHDSWCCEIHDVDENDYPVAVCVSLGYMCYMTSRQTVLIDGIQCNPAVFHNEAARYQPINTTKWTRIDLDEEENLDVQA
jgi:hypothetical protein